MTTQLTPGTQVRGFRVEQALGVDPTFEWYSATRVDGGERLSLVVLRRSVTSLTALRERLAALNAGAAIDGADFPIEVIAREGATVLVTRPPLGEVPTRGDVALPPFERLKQAVGVVARLHASRLTHGALSERCLRVTAEGRVVIHLAGFGDLLDHDATGAPDRWSPPWACHAPVDAARRDVYALAAFARELVAPGGLSSIDRRRWRALGLAGADRTLLSLPDSGHAYPPQVRAIVDAILKGERYAPTNAVVLAAVLGVAPDEQPTTRALDWIEEPFAPAAPHEMGRQRFGWRASVGLAALLVAAVVITMMNRRQPEAVANAAPMFSTYTPACASDADCRTALTCSDGLCVPAGFVFVPAGTFRAGAGDGVRLSDDMPEFEATITRGFYLQAHEFTQGEWEALFGNQPSYFSSCGSRCPVDSVNWWEAIEAANRRSVAEGLEPCYTPQSCRGEPGAGCGFGDVEPETPHFCRSDYGCRSVLFSGLECEGYRLPTEIEWEYAARGGTASSHYAGSLSSDDDTAAVELLRLATIAVTSSNAAVDYQPAWPCSALDLPHPDAPGCGPSEVGLREPNAFGLHDMIGNLSEHVYDASQRHPLSAPPSECENPRIGEHGELECRLTRAIDRFADGRGPRVTRGGDFFQAPVHARAASRGISSTRARSVNIGFRLARTVLEPAVGGAQ